MINKNTVEVKALIEMQKQMNDKYTMEKNLTELIRKDFADIDRITVSDTSISVDTKHHSMYMSKWSDNAEEIIEPCPKMVCDGDAKMPETIEEFNEMKSLMADSKQQCAEVFSLLAPMFFEKEYKYLKTKYEELKAIEASKEDDDSGY